MDHLRRLLRYDIWANRESLASLGRDPPAKSLRWLSHIVGAERLWMARLRAEQPALPVWPDLDVKGCARELDDLAGDWLDYLAGAGPERSTRQVAYTNTKGESWTNTVEEILTHVTIHSAYHGGQIAAALRSAGRVPAYTDYIHAVRQELVQ